MIGMRTAGVIAVLAAAALWGTTGTLQALLPPARDPLAVGALRLIFGAATLIVLAMPDPAARRAFPTLPWRFIATAGVAIGLYNMVFFHAVANAGVGIGTAVAIGSAPIWATSWEAAHGRLPGWRKAVGQALAILGVVVLAGTAGDAGSLDGVLLALLAGASYAAYSLATSRAAATAPVASVAAATFTVAAVLTAPVLLTTSLDWVSGPAWVTLGFLGIGATGVAYAFYTWGLARVAASTAVTLALAEPVTAWVLSVFVVGEPVTPSSALGAGLVLAGLAAVARAGRRP